jgi:cobalt/nickel transport system permease protein
MGAGHTHALYVHEHSRLHRMAPEAKLVAALLIVASIAVTPPQAIWAFALFAVGLAALIRSARLPFGFVLARLAVVIPFLLFALLIPFIAGGEQIEVFGVSLSREGLWGMWNVFAKATLGATTSIVLAGTTEIAEMLRGMTVLRVPPALTAIAMFMVRYLVVVSNELARMRVAMTARGYDPRWLWQAKPIAASAGALFIRSYERGERVHAAMLARGYSGTMPEINRRRAGRNDWLLAAAAMAGAVLVAALGVVNS